MNLKDQRQFRRCQKDTDLTLKFKNKFIKAKMTNYSPGGIGAVIKNIAPIGKGDVVEIIAEGPEIRTYGKVAWSVIDKSVLRLGLKNIGRIKGLTDDYGLTDILIGLQRGNRTGVLTVESGDIVKSIYIKNGDMIFSRSNQDEDRLGDILLKAGKINKEQYDRSVIEIKRTNQRQGTALVKLGYLAPNKLLGAVQNQVEHIIESLFDLKDGRFEFQERPLPNEEVITLKLSAANLIYRGIKKIKSISRIQRGLLSIDYILNFSANPLDLFQNLNLDNAGKKIISRIDGKTSIKDIISITQVDAFEALKTVYALLGIGTIELRQDPAACIETHEEVVEEALEKKQHIPEHSKFKKIIEDMHSKCERLGHYGVLEVKGHASGAEIKAAYYKAAKQFHPDMHFHYADDSLKDKLSDIFSYVYEAYSTLSDPRKRKKYDEMMTVDTKKVRAAKERATAAFEEGNYHLKKENYQDAERFFAQAAYFDASISEYHYHYGLTLAIQNKVKAAGKAFERALMLDPLSARYLAELGFVHLELGHIARAKGLFEKALGVSSDNARAAEGLNKIKNNS